MSMKKKVDIKAIVQEEGLQLLGVSSVEVQSSHALLEQWLAKQQHAGMEFMVRDAPLRKSVDHVLKDAQSALVLGLIYHQKEKAGRTSHQGRFLPKVAQYARFRDYHKLIKISGQRIIEKIKQPSHEYRIVSDSAPLLERRLAQNSQAFFIGKNTCAIHHSQGSLLLLGEILTTHTVDELSRLFEWEKPQEDEKKMSCGSCDRCQVACPTGALDKAYSLDANLCLSYWTIEHRGLIPEKFWPHFNTYYFGCDICQLVCPKNKEKEDQIQTSPLIQTKKMPTLYQTAIMGQKEYEAYFGGTPMTRAKKDGLKRNALIAMKVTGDPLLSEAMTKVRLEALSPLLLGTLRQIEAYSNRV